MQGLIRLPVVCWIQRWLIQSDWCSRGTQAAWQALPLTDASELSARFSQRLSVRALPSQLQAVARTPASPRCLAGTTRVPACEFHGNGSPISGQMHCLSPLLPLAAPEAWLVLVTYLRSSGVCAPDESLAPLLALTRHTDLTIINAVNITSACVKAWHLPANDRPLTGCACLRQTFVYLASCMGGPLPMAEYFSEFAGGRSLLRFDYDPELPAADLPLGVPRSVVSSRSRQPLGARPKYGAGVLLNIMVVHCEGTCRRSVPAALPVRPRAACHRPAARNPCSALLVYAV